MKFIIIIIVKTIKIIMKAKTRLVMRFPCVLEKSGSQMQNSKAGVYDLKFRNQCKINSVVHFVLFLCYI